MNLEDKAVDTEIARVLAVALAIGADRGLNETLRGLAGVAVGAAFAVSQPDQNSWLTVESGRVVATRRPPSGVATVESEALRANGHSIARAMSTALVQSTALADAAKLVGPLLGPQEVPSRRQFAALMPWAPALEQIAYKTAASIAVTLDLLRPHILSDLHAGARVRPRLLRQYWQRMHAAAQFFLLASDAAAGPWLGEMARQFDWGNWTPTFTLLRERTTWLAACAARSAAAFGEPVVPGYLAALEGAAHPFRAFDALFGLAAIALGNPTLAPSIAADIRLLRRGADARGGLTSPYVRHAYADAIALIDRTASWAGGDAEEIVALGWAAGSSSGLATDIALRTDPAIVTQSGHLLGFVTLPVVFATPVAEFNPDRRTGGKARQATPTDAIADVLRGAWGAPSKTARVLH
ncbi:MAG: hypothetical protein ISP49_15430 [Reyranella sp.]|nr:hypothetical protein [Reyranella sp.]MBL6652987.1 hypothetical protein [Reyranella sp.]